MNVHAFGKQRATDHATTPAPLDVMESFSYRLIPLILDALFNKFTDNHDAIRFGPAKLDKDWKETICALFRRLGFYRQEYLCSSNMLRHLAPWSQYFLALERLYTPT